MDKTKFRYRTISGLLIILFCAGCAISRTAADKFLYDKSRIIQSAKDIIILAPDSGLPQKEMLTYKINWLGIPVGNLTLAIKGVQNINARDAYVLEAVFKSNFFLSMIYKITDRFVSYMDVEKLYTLRHEAYRSEGFYKKDAVTDFDQAGHKAHFRNATDKTEKNYDIPEAIQDTLTACYYFMLLPVNVGDKISYGVSNNESNYELFGVIEPKVLLKTDLGPKEAFSVQPYIKLNGEIADKGSLAIYFSCDKRRVPLLGILKGPLFTELTFSLTKIEN